MENASKAIIIAGSILIGVIILSIFSYLYASIGGSAKNIQQELDSKTISEFNSNFYKYQGSKECTIHDIVSVASFARQNNKDFDSGSVYWVDVILDGIKLTSLNDEDYTKKYTELLKDYSVTDGKIQYYTCGTIGTENVGEVSRITSITFTKNR